MPKSLSEIQVREMMTTKIIAAQSDDNVMDIARIMVEKGLHGLPVVDHGHKLLGMVSTKELLNSKGVYLPTAISLLQNLHVIHGEDITSVDQKLASLKKLRAKDVMNHDPFYLIDTASLEQAAEAFVLHGEDLLPVVDHGKILVGVVGKGDILKCLVNPLEPITSRPAFTVESEDPSAIEEMGKQFVMVSRGRAKFWYISTLVFFAIGIIIALALILRIRII